MDIENRQIVTATVQKSGGRIKRFVHPRSYFTTEAVNAEMLRDLLRRNVRVMLMDAESNPVADFYNVMNAEGKLEPCARVLKHFKETCHAVGNLEVVVKHKGKIAGKETLDRLDREVRQYRESVAARVKAVPRRYVRAECPKCGNVFEVQLAGFGN